ncbi:MAG: ribosomal-processing cysteine protease Prp [Eubacterium sp.]|nr:ribosomal-processing cysteine protease Prp [Eubacterium sp.]
MIKAVFYKKDDLIFGFSVKGHAGYAVKGKDIICSAVSSLVINTINSIEKYTDDKFVGETSESGNLKFKVVSDVSSSSELLINSLYLGLSRISEENGRNFVKVYIREV